MMLGVQDNPFSRITPRLLTVDEGDAVMSLTVTDSSEQGQSFSGMKRSSDLLRLSLR